MTSLSSVSDAEKFEFQLLFDNEKNLLEHTHRKFRQHSKRTGFYVLGASFFIVSAFIVITCGSLCFMLPGVNVIHHIILPAILPGIGALFLSCPFILLAIKSNLNKNAQRKEMISLMFHYLTEYDIARETSENRTRFILHNFLQWPKEENSDELIKNEGWSKEYQGKILTDLKKGMGDAQTYAEPKNIDEHARKKIAASIDKALEYLHKK